MRLFGRERDEDNYTHMLSMWRCSCGENHFVSVKWVFDPDQRVADDAAYLSVIEEAKGSEPLLQRIRAAWGILFGRSHTWSEVVLTADDLRDFVDGAKVLERRIHGT